MKERATELEYLRWFYANADFGPANEDVREYLNEAFKRYSGKDLPENYENEDYT